MHLSLAMDSEKRMKLVYEAAAVGVCNEAAVHSVRPRRVNGELAIATRQWNACSEARGEQAAEDREDFVLDFIEEE